MSNWLIGTTGRSFIDVWTLPHLAFWTFIGSAIWPFAKGKDFGFRVIALAVCLFWAFAWEVFEKTAEARWSDLWLNPESWLNSWVSDPLTVVVGVLGMMWMLDKWARRRT